MPSAERIRVLREKEVADTGAVLEVARGKFRSGAEPATKVLGEGESLHLDQDKNEVVGRAVEQSSGGEDQITLVEFGEDRAEQVSG